MSPPDQVEYRSATTSGLRQDGPTTRRPIDERASPPRTTEADLLEPGGQGSRLEDRDVATALRALTDREVRDVQLIADAWSSVAFAATLDGSEVVARLKRRPAVDTTCRYEVEAATVAHLRAHGIPVPEAVARGPWNDFDVCISRRVPGVSLESLALERGPDDLAVRQGAIDAGRVLRAIHEAPPPPHELPANTRIGSKTIHKQLARVSEAHELEVAAAATERIDTVLDGPAPRALTHGGFGADHVFVAPNSGTVTAILDWERASMGDPARDLGWWDARFGDHHGPTPTASLVRRGYGIVADSTFDERAHAWAIYEALARGSRGSGAGITDLHAGMMARTRELLAQHRAPARGSDHASPDR